MCVTLNQATHTHIDISILQHGEMRISRYRSQSFLCHVSCHRGMKDGCIKSVISDKSDCLCVSFWAVSHFPKSSWLVHQFYQLLMAGCVLTNTSTQLDTLLSVIYNRLLYITSIQLQKYSLLMLIKKNCQANAVEIK